MSDNILSRSQLIDLSNAAYQSKNFILSRKILIAWLKKFPNDLWIRYRLAIVLYKIGKTDDAIRLGESIVAQDPEFEEVWALLGALYPDDGSEKKLVLQRLRFLKKEREMLAEDKKTGFFSWFRKPPQKNDDEEDFFDEDDFDILTAALNAKKMLTEDDYSSNLRLLKIYSRRWPKALQFQLVLGDTLNRMGNTDEGIAIIHATVQKDIMAQVANRIWSGKNPYQNLWLNSDSFKLDITPLQIPKEIAASAGLEHVLSVEQPMRQENAEDEKPSGVGLVQAEVGEATSPLAHEQAQLDQEPQTLEGEGKSESSQSEEPIQEERRALKKTDHSLKGKLWDAIFKKNNDEESLKKEPIPIKEFIYKISYENSDDRYPTYVVLSTVGGLTAKYGKNNKDFIDQEMRSVADAIENRGGWSAMVYYPDEFNYIGAGKMDGNSIRDALVTLDQKLSEKGSMIGAVLIVGGDDVVPFFALPNTTNDDDIAIFSDSPYGINDRFNHFEQQWQLGRIPGDNSNDPGLLMSQLREIQNYHITLFNRRKALGKKSASERRMQTSSSAKVRKGFKAFGYSCAAWEKPSSAVFKNISDPSALLTSPEMVSTKLESAKLENVDYGYFNLHGLKGQPNWYGQKRAIDSASTPLIPIALEIGNITPIQKTPKIIFSESCYGAEIQNRDESNAISLQFIGKTTRVFIGSTTIAYGALNLPLTAADLLAHLFWKHLLTGISAGEAFRRARKNLAMEIEATYGGLDAEIQKTLLSFVFYGDPLYSVDESADINDRMQRSKSPRKYDLFNEKVSHDLGFTAEMAKKVFNEVKSTCKIDSVDDDSSHFIIYKQCSDKNSKYARHTFTNAQNYVISYMLDKKIGGLVKRTIIRVTVRDDGAIQKISFSR